MINLNLITGFEWDTGNTRKNEKHGVTAAEAEQVFFNQPLLQQLAADSTSCGRWTLAAHHVHATR